MKEQESTARYNVLLQKCRAPDADTEKLCKEMDCLLNIDMISVEQLDYVFTVLTHRERPWPKKG